MIQFRQLSRSFRYALRGIVRVTREEQSFRIQLVVAFFALIGMFLFDLSVVEKGLITLAIGSVLVLELLNSIFERVVDLLKPRIHHYVEDVKDIMAGVVFVAALGALLIGVLIFGAHVDRFRTLFGV